MEIKNSIFAPPQPKISSDIQASSASKAVVPVNVSSIENTTQSKDTKISDAEIEKAIEKSNKILSQKSTGIEFSLDKDSGKTIVKLIDKQTNEVLRQYPTKQMLAIAKDIDRFQGSLVSEKI